MEAANGFLRERYIATFNEKFTAAPAEKGTAFRRTARADLDWIFTVQTERVVAKDNTVAIGDRDWQVEKSRFRNSLAGCTVTIHQHLDGNVSIRYGPHVVGHYDADARPRETFCKKTRDGRGKGGTVEAVENRKTVSHRSHRPLEIPKRDSHFPTAATTGINMTKNRKPRSASSRGTSGLVN